jgi:hypothetical protein
MRKILFLTTMFAFILTSSAWAADISGTWTLKYTGQQGDERSYDMVIKAAGENLTITATHPSLGEMAGTGTLKGNDITINLTATGEMQVGFLLTGTVSGNKMSGTREVQVPEGDMEGRSGAPGGAASGAPGGAASGAPGGAPSGPPGGDSGDDSGRSGGPMMGGDSEGRTGGPMMGGDSEGRSSMGPPGGDSEGAPREETGPTPWTAEKK